MNFAFSEEQEELRKSVRRFLEDKSPETEVRLLMETSEGYDTAVWRQMAEQLGLQGLAIPEEYGGSGYGYVELIVVFEEMGRSLLCAPYFSTVALAANLLLSAGDDAANQDYLPGLASGQKIGTVALAEASGRWDERGVTLEASGSGGHLDAQWGEAVRTRRPCRGSDPGGSAHVNGRFGVCSRQRGCRAERPSPVDDGPDPQAGPSQLRLHACSVGGSRRRGLGGHLEDVGPRCGGVGCRAGWRRAVRFGDGG